MSASLIAAIVLALGIEGAQFDMQFFTEHMSNLGQKIKAWIAGTVPVIYFVAPKYICYFDI